MKVVLMCILLVGAVVGFSIPPSEFDKFIDNVAIPFFSDGMREEHKTSQPIDKQLFPYVNFESGEMIGLDSLVRTDHCTVNDDGHRLSVDAHIGWSFLALVFSDMEMDGQRMSGIMKLSGVAVHADFTLDEESCAFEIRELRVENTVTAVLYSSVPQYNGKDVTDHFKDTVVPGINKKITDNLPAIKLWAQNVCKIKHSTFLSLMNIS